MCLFSLKNRAETGTNMPFSLEKLAGYDYNGNKESVLEWAGDAVKQEIWKQKL